MARQKRTSTPITDAETRAAGLSSINAGLDLGDSRTLAAFNTKIAAAKDKLNKYNATLAQSDAELNSLEVAEEELSKMSSAYLKAVGLKYGTDSDEYEMAGGTRDSERKKPGRKSAAAKKPPAA